MNQIKPKNERQPGYQFVRDHRLLPRAVPEIVTKRHNLTQRKIGHASQSASVHQHVRIGMLENYCDDLSLLRGSIPLGIACIRIAADPAARSVFVSVVGLFGFIRVLLAVGRECACEEGAASRVASVPTER